MSTRQKENKDIVAKDYYECIWKMGPEEMLISAGEIRISEDGLGGSHWSGGQGADATQSSRLTFSRIDVVIG